MKSHLRLAAAAVLTSALCVGAVAVAQDAGPPQRPDHAQWDQRMQAHREAHLHALHDLLNIHPDQEAAFQAFAQSMHADKGDWRGRHDAEAGAPLTTPQRLDRMEARMAERDAAFKRRADAVRTFYAALSPDQQRTFDALHDLAGGHHHGMGSEGMPHPHGPGGPGGPPAQG
jgi:hypothetical protein